MGYFPVRYDSRVVIYNHRAVIRLATACAEAVKPKPTITRMLAQLPSMRRLMLGDEITL